MALEIRFQFTASTVRSSTSATSPAAAVVDDAGVVKVNEQRAAARLTILTWCRDVLPRKFQSNHRPAKFGKLRRSLMSSFPNFAGRWLLWNFRGRTSLHHVRIVNRAAARCSLTFTTPASSTTAAAGDVADVEDRTVEAVN